MLGAGSALLRHRTVLRHYGVGLSERRLGHALQRGAEGQKFDEQPAIGETVDDLDLPALEPMLDRPVDEAVLKTLGLVVADQRRLVPTYGRVLVAGKNRERLFSGTWGQVASFRGEKRIDIFDQAEYHRAPAAGAR
ncbi:hypothetical protein [Galbitalea sp. SE-J8]|uniref:hypothetical protein n=1 Tax=Galbitalea sp. SE-J8 TaxID=3054952 RepID=UPI00338FB578